MTSYFTIGVTSGGAGTSSIDIVATGTATGSNGGELVNANIANLQSPIQPQIINLSSGANTINSTTCPAIATAGGVIIKPPAGNTQTITLKGVTGDTGIALNLTAPQMILFPATPPTSFVITAGGSITGMELVWI